MPALWHWKHLASSVSLPGASGNPGAFGLSCANAARDRSNAPSRANRTLDERHKVVFTDALRPWRAPFTLNTLNQIDDEVREPLRIGEQRLARAVMGDAAAVEDHRVVGDAERHLGVLLDEDKRQGILGDQSIQCLEERFNEDRGEAFERLEGLAPIIIESLLKALNRLITEDSLALVLVEQHAKVALGVTHHAMVLNRGRVAHYGPSEALLADPQRLSNLIVDLV